jgi:hypothetical protein
MQYGRPGDVSCSPQRMHITWVQRPAAPNGYVQELVAPGAPPRVGRWPALDDQRLEHAHDLLGLLRIDDELRLHTVTIPPAPHPSNEVLAGDSPVRVMADPPNCDEDRTEAALTLGGNP